MRSEKSEPPTTGRGTQRSSAQGPNGAVTKPGSHATEQKANRPVKQGQCLEVHGHLQQRVGPWPGRRLRDRQGPPAPCGNEADRSTPAGSSPAVPAARGPLVVSRQGLHPQGRKYSPPQGVEAPLGR